ncbi:Protein of unknown function [Bacillus toyonensis]|jgi:hypothetical protein
MSI